MDSLSRRATTIAIFSLTVVLLSFSLSLAAGAGQAEPSLELIPTQLTANTFSPALPVYLEVHLKAGSDLLTHIKISTFSNDGIAVDFEGRQSELLKLEANSEHSWQLRLIRSSSITAPAKLFVRAAFDTGETRAPIHRLLYQTVDIVPRGAVAPASLAQGEIIGPPSILSHERGGELLLKVTNQYSRRLQIGEITIFKPKFVNFTNPQLTTISNDYAVVLVQDPKKPPLQEVGAGQAMVIPLTMGALPQVVPGKYGVMAVVGLKADDGLTQTIMASHEIEVVVLGESDLLRLVGAPSLLFLPGVLSIITWRLLWSIGKPSAERTSFPLQTTNSDFWVVAIVLSLLTPLVYPGYTELFFGERRDYLVSYGFKDFAFTFGLAIGFALLSYLAYLLTAWLYRKLRAWNVSRHVPVPGDKPLRILNKLANLKQDIVLRKVYPIGGNQADCVLVLEPWSSDTELWLTPQAELKLTQQGAQDYIAMDEQDKIVSRQLTDARSVARLIEDGINNHWWTIEWKPVGAVQAPMTAKRNAWTDIPQHAPLVS